MGFSGGGSNVLLPHTHDGTVTQDGGPLNFNNITQSQSSAGEVFYSDGVHLQQLAYPGVPAGETLTAAAASTAPTWVAAAAPGASILTLVSHTTVPANTTTIDVTFANIPLAGLSELYIVTAGSNGGNEVGMQIYDQTSTLLTGSLYRHAGLLTVTGAQTIIDSGTGNTSILVAPTSIEPHAAVVHLMLGGAGNNLKYNVQVAGGNGTGNAFATLGGWYAANGVTGISGIKLGITASDSIERETYLDIYKRSNS